MKHLTLKQGLISCRRSCQIIVCDFHIFIIWKHAGQSFQIRWNSLVLFTHLIIFSWILSLRIVRFHLPNPQIVRLLILIVGVETLSTSRTLSSRFELVGTQSFLPLISQIWRHNSSQQICLRILLLKGLISCPIFFILTRNACLKSICEYHLTSVTAQTSHCW